MGYLTVSPSFQLSIDVGDYRAVPPGWTYLFRSIFRVAARIATGETIAAIMWRGVGSPSYALEPVRQTALTNMAHKTRLFARL
jgi:hypothetical protein